MKALRTSNNNQHVYRKSSNTLPFFRSSSANKSGAGNNGYFFSKRPPQLQKTGDSTERIQRHTCENDAAVGSSLGLSCAIDSSPNPGATEAIPFTIESSEVRDPSALSNFVDNWRASGGNDQLVVNGFASCDGAEAYNWQLSCSRANALAAELVSLGVDPSKIDVYANGETDHFSATSLSPNRVATVGFGSTPGPTPTPTPTPTPPPSLPRVIPCTPTPQQIFSRGSCGTGTDFTHNDFPSLAGASTAERAAVWEADNLTLDFQLRNRMRLELSLLAGSEGRRMVTHFSGGTGSTLTHDTSSVLGPLAMASGTFTSLHSAVLSEITSQIASMHTAGVIDCNAIALAPASVPASHFTFSDGAALKGIIGGTQGLEIRITRFEVDPATRDFSISIQYLICDDFGVDQSDLYSPALVAFWVLQHRRTGHLPFINELDLPKSESGTY